VNAHDFRSPWSGANPLAGRAALVTGAGRGIGRGIAQELASVGAHVVAGDIDHAGAAETVELVGGRGEAVHLDVAEPASVEAALAGRRIDVLVNVAGRLTVSPVVDLAVEDWDDVMRVNARGVFLVTRAALPAMIEAGSGAIVNIASVSGKAGEPTLAHYSASKFAVVGFTQALAKEVAPHGIRVNAVCPGVVRTPMIEQVSGAWGQSADAIAADLQLIPRPQDPREIGAAVVFLATMPSITGQAINVDGGTVFN
jgi:meso-butanediol dehydrogenase/(S,S)-butanediol dehydrogenase/diacetyl reductase